MGDLLSISLTDSRSDPERFTAFYEGTSQRVLVFVARRVLDAELAMEIVAETFARAYVKRAQYKGGTDAEAEAWVIRIAQREVAGYFRRSAVERKAIKRLGIEVPQLSDGDIARVEELADIEIQRERLGEAMDALPAPQRDAVRLRISEELPYPEVASRLAITEQAARARVARGLRTLREGFKENRISEELPTWT
jgi:RNA polymerase sigma-70 factor (ECF subfamily)